MAAMRRLVAVLAALLLALGACGAPPPSASPSPVATSCPNASAAPATSGDIAAVFRAIQDQVVADRCLAAEQRLEPMVLTRAEARTRLGEQFRKDNAPDTIAVAEGTLKALGLLPAGASLGDLYVELLGSQVAGFYDPAAKEIFVVSGSAKVGATEKATFAHEFTHALQDQHFGLEEIDVDAVGRGDRSLGRLALVEGDATLLMTLFVSRYLTPTELQELLRVDPATQAQLDSMPAILRETLLFPYLQGLIFVNGIWMRGGWEAVDKAYGRLPDSTEQILHPAKYDAGEQPVDVPLDGAALAAGMGAGWRETPADTLGEFQLSVWLRENGVEAPAAGNAAAGWGGDRYVYLRGPNGAYALALLTAWDSQPDADEFLAAARTAAGNLPGAAEVRVVATMRGTGQADRVAVLVASDASTLTRLSKLALAGLP
jgi:hypothetical protein